jgi:hypothetical protein
MGWGAQEVREGAGRKVGLGWVGLGTFGGSEGMGERELCVCSDFSLRDGRAGSVDSIAWQSGREIECC